MQEILKKPFLTNTDITTVLNCSKSKASRIKQIINNDLKQHGKRLVTNEVPTHLFIELMNLEKVN